MSETYFHYGDCAGISDRTGAFIGCDCNVAKIKAAQAERDQLRATVAHLDLAARDRSQLEDQLFDAIADREAMCEALSTAEGERDQLRAENDRIRGQIDRQNDATIRAEQKADELQVELDRLKVAYHVDVDHLTGRLSDAAQQFAALQRQAESWRNTCAEVQASRDELRRSQDLFIRHLAQPSRFRSYIQPRLTPADGHLQIVLPDGEVVGTVTERILGGWMATFDLAGWAVPFQSQAQAVDWLTELAQYAAWADLQQAAAAAVEEE